MGFPSGGRTCRVSKYVNLKLKNTRILHDKSVGGIFEDSKALVDIETFHVRNDSQVQRLYDVNIGLLQRWLHYDTVNF